jgi:hypothetical protein
MVRNTIFYILYIQLFLLLTGQAGESSRILSAFLTVGGGLQMEFEARDGDYYTLYHGHHPHDICVPLQMALPEGSSGRFLVDPEILSNAEQHFFVLRSASMSDPRDTDMDGIDDLFEWFTPRLNPLDASDAAQDWDHDGATNVEEYVMGTQLSVADVFHLTSLMDDLLVERVHEDIVIPIRAAYADGRPASSQWVTLETRLGDELTRKEKFLTNEDGWIRPVITVALGTLRVTFTSEHSPRPLEHLIASARMEVVGDQVKQMPVGSETRFEFRILGDLPLEKMKRHPFQITAQHVSGDYLPVTASSIDGFGVAKLMTPEGGTRVHIASPLFPGQDLFVEVEGLVFAAHKLEFPEPSPSDGQTTWVKQNQWKQFSVQAKNEAGQPQPGVPVSFRILEGVARFGPDKAFTDQNGVAKVSVLPMGPGILSLEVTSGAVQPAVKSVATRPITYEQDVRPVFAKCVVCHDANHGLPFETYEQVRHGVSPWTQKPVVNATQPDLSPLIYLTEPPYGAMYQNALWANPDDPLTENDAALLGDWVRSGALRSFDLPGAPEEIQFVSFLDQLGVPETRFPVSLTFRVLDGRSRPVPLADAVVSSNVSGDILKTSGKTDFDGKVHLTLEFDQDSRDRRILIQVPESPAMKTLSLPMNPSYDAGFLGSSTSPVDQALAGVLKAHNLSPAQRTSKSEFLRRIVADATGRHPDLNDPLIGPVIAEYISVDSDTKEDRMRLIENLVDSELFLDHWIGERISTWIEVPAEADPRHGSPKFDAPVKALLQQNDSLGDLVATLGLLGGNGPSWESVPFSEAGFAITSTHDVMEFGRNSLDQLLGAFTGQSIACARCHDHKLTGPEDEVTWTQEQAHDVYAFSVLNIAGLDMIQIDGSIKKHEVEFPVWWGSGDELPYRSEIALASPGGEWIANQIRHRAELWSWIVKSPLFSRAVSHRLWAELWAPMVDPVDIRNSTLEPLRKNGLIEVMQALQDQFLADDMGLRRFLKSLFSTHAYQLSSEAPEGYAALGDSFFARFPVRRHFAEVLDHGFYSIAQFPFSGHAFLPLKLMGYPQRRIVPYWDHRRNPAGVTEALMLLNSRETVDWKANHFLSRIQNQTALSLANATTREARTSLYLEAAREMVFLSLMRDPTEEEFDAIRVLEPSVESLVDLAVALGVSSEFVFR